MLLVATYAATHDFNRAYKVQTTITEQDRIGSQLIRSARAATASFDYYLYRCIACGLRQFSDHVAAFDLSIKFDNRKFSCMPRSRSHKHEKCMTCSIGYRSFVNSFQIMWRRLGKFAVNLYDKHERLNALTFIETQSLDHTGSIWKNDFYPSAWMTKSTRSVT